MKKQLLIILTLSIGVHFMFFGNPNETVFDEVHFGKFISAYYTGEYYFDIHPPLGKLAIAGFVKIVDFRPEYNFTEIGKEFPDKKYLALRLLPTIAGTLLPLIIYLLILELGISHMAAFTGALLIIFDNALLTQSRLILLDPFLLLFGFTSLLFYFRYRRQSQPQHSHILTLPIRSFMRRKENMRMLWNSNLFLMAVFAGLAISIKWTGLSFVALPIAIESYEKFKTLLTNQSYDRFVSSVLNLAKFASFFFISLVIYFSIFALHFALLPKPGPGDAFMKPDFREQNIVKNIWNLNIEMYKSNQRITASHPYSSQFYTWPFMARPIYYWVKDTARIYFMGNPVIWWTSSAAVLAGLWLIAREVWDMIKTKKLFTSRYSLVVILLGGYWLNLLPFVGVKRVMFLYHYLTALIFAIIMLVYLIDKNLFDPNIRPSSVEAFRANKNSRKIFTGIIIAAIAVFIFFAPLSYGLPLSSKAYGARVWFASWR